MSKHAVSHADELLYGPAWHRGAQAGRRGVPMSPNLIQVDLGVPAATDADGIAASQNPSGGGALTLTGDPVTLDVPRNITITSTGDDSGATFTVTGTDEYGHPMTEAITGANAGAAAGAKAFKTVTGVEVDAATADSVTVGWGDVLGLPYRVGGAWDVLAFYADGTEELGDATLAAGDGDDATATTGDVRGTIAPSTAADGSVQYRVWMSIHDVASKDGAYGVAQA